jgi:pimeloyl-ACP methyl ester carboxylesterase
MPGTPLTRTAPPASSRSSGAASIRAAPAARIFSVIFWDKITCPLFVIAGGLDRLCPPQDAQRLAAQAKGPVELLVIEDGNHVAHNRFYKYRARSADWMAAQLGAAAK